MSLTTRSNVVVALPPVLVAVIVYVVSEEITVGVPLITPDESMLMPFGRAGEIDHDTTGPPLIVGDAADIGESLVSTSELGV